MLKIGELSKICNVSTQTLRYYDREAILCPEEVDKSNGYRYYSLKQVEVLNRIMKLKELGFGLSEIKKILEGDEGERRKLYKEKIEVLRSEAENRRDNICEIRNLFQDNEGDQVSKQCSLRQQIQALAFENDEQAIGKWEFKGRCQTLPREISKLLSVENLDTNDERLPKTLFFLPGGSFYWVYAWTKGILYRVSVSLSLLIPNEYRIVTSNGKEYMLINWLEDDCFVGDRKSCLSVYQKIDGKHYTERETHIFCDDTDIPYVEDPKFVGTWKACALVGNISEFSPEKKYDDEKLYITGIRAMPRGLCIKEMRDGELRYEISQLYSGGVLIHKSMETVEHYKIKEMTHEKQTDTYLFLEHKSGDYVYGGRVNAYYVFKKDSQ